MALFGRRGSRPAGRGIKATAVIRESERSGEGGGPDDGEPWPWELELNRFGTRRYRLRLEVRIPDGEAYQVDGEFKVPRKAENTGFFAGGVGNKLAPGLELPVHVDPADRGAVEVDWDTFLASPGRKDAQRATNQAASNRAVAAQLEKNPKVAAKLRANNRSAVRAWATAVQSGAMTREDFERTVTQEIECGRMDPADAGAARATLK